MAWYLICINLIFAALVVGGIVGSHAWAIATQHRDWPARAREATRTELTIEPAVTAPLVRQAA